MVYTWRKLSTISPKNSDKGKKYMTYTDKDYVQGSFNLRKLRSNNMHNFFSSNTSEFSGNFEGMLNEGTYKTKIQNMYNHGGKTFVY